MQLNSVDPRASPSLNKAGPLLILFGMLYSFNHKAGLQGLDVG